MPLRGREEEDTSHIKRKSGRSMRCNEGNRNLTIRPTHQRRTDPREQPPSQAYTYRSYEEGYTDLSEPDSWPYEGEKLRPEPKNQKSMGGLLALVVLLCAAFIAGERKAW